MEAQQNGKGISRIWIVMIIYIFVIYLTLPINRLVLKFIYSTIDFGAFSFVVDLSLFICPILVFFFALKRGLVVSLLTVIPLFLALLFIFRAKLPEERIHFLEYGLLGYLALRAMGTKFRQIVTALIFVALVGGLDEFIQLFLPNRVGDLRDVAMDVIGGALGLWVGICISSGWGIGRH